MLAPSRRRQARIYGFFMRFQARRGGAPGVESDPDVRAAKAPIQARAPARRLSRAFARQAPAPERAQAQSRAAGEARAAPARRHRPQPDRGWGLSDLRALSRL